MRSSGTGRPSSGEKQPIAPPRLPARNHEIAKDTRRLAMSGRSLVRQTTPRYRVLAYFGGAPRPERTAEFSAQVQNRHPPLGFLVLLGRAARGLVNLQRQLQARLFGFAPQPFLLFTLPDLLNDERR